MAKALTRRRVGGALALLVVVAVVLIVVLGNSPTSSAGANNAPASSSAGTTTVRRRDLVETDTESGTLSYANPETVYNRLSGTITWLPTVGQLIRPGQALYKIDGVPVMLMKGATPAYRDLSPADTSGPDILELNRNLIALGFNPSGIVADDTWQAATSAGVDMLQAYLGQAETGVLTLGQVVFLPDPQLVSTLDQKLGADPTGGTSAASLATAALRDASTEFVDLRTGTSTVPATTTTTTTGPSPRPGRPPAHGCPKGKASKPKHRCSSTPTTLQALVALLRAEIAELKSRRPSAPSGHSGPSGASHSSASSRQSNSSTAGGGAASGGGGGTGGGGSSGGGGSATAVLETTSTQLVVTVDLDASKQSEARVGERVTVEMPAGDVVDGKISAVSSVASSSSGSSGGGSGGGGSPGGGGSNGSSGSSSSIPVTITLKHAPEGAGLDQAAVSVNFAQAQARNVLSVPVTALLAVPGGGYAVQEAGSPHRLVGVTTGLFAAGYVQISGSGITDGLQVTNSEG